MPHVQILWPRDKQLFVYLDAVAAIMKDGSHWL